MSLKFKIFIYDNIHVLMLFYMKQITSPGLIHETEGSGAGALG